MFGRFIAVSTPTKYLAVLVWATSEIHKPDSECGPVRYYHGAHRIHITLGSVLDVSALEDNGRVMEYPSLRNINSVHLIKKKKLKGQHNLGALADVIIYRNIHNLTNPTNPNGK